MRITCPACTTSYVIPDEKIGETGRSVRCVRCGTRWHARPAGDLDDLFEDAAPPPRRAAEPPVRPAATEDREAATADPIEDAAFAKAADAPEPTREALETEKGEAAEPGPAGGAFFDDDEAAPGRAPVAKPKDIESLAERPAIKVKPAKKRKPPMPRPDFAALLHRIRPVAGWAMVALALAAPGIMLLAREPIVRAFPVTASLFEAAGFPVNLRGLEFKDLQTMRELEDGQSVLVVEGTIANPGGSTRPVPRVRLSLRSDDTQEIYAWSVEPKAQTLPPGGSVRFRSKLAAPPDQARDVQLRFIDRSSRQAAIHDKP